MWGQGVIGYFFNKQENCPVRDLWVNPPKNFGLVRLQEEETRESYEIYLSRITTFPDTISQIVVYNNG